MWADRQTDWQTYRQTDTVVTILAPILYLGRSKNVKRRFLRVYDRLVNRQLRSWQRPSIVECRLWTFSVSRSNNRSSTRKHWSTSRQTRSVGLLRTREDDSCLRRQPFTAAPSANSTRCLDRVHINFYAEVSITGGGQWDESPGFGVWTLMHISLPLPRFCHVSKFQAPDCLRCGTVHSRWKCADFLYTFVHISVEFWLPHTSVLQSV